MSYSHFDEEVLRVIKKIICLIFFTGIFILEGCSFGRGRIFYVNEDEKADARMEQILTAIKAKDRDAIKALFSKQALSEVDDFDEEFDYLLDFFQGDVESCKRDKWSSNESVEYGKRSLMIRSWYKVSTDKGNFLFFVIDFAEDTINTDNAGLYTLRVIKAEDKDKHFTYWQDMQIAGIYIPDDNENINSTSLTKP
jgi:hypothetical protein